MMALLQIGVRACISANLLNRRVESVSVHFVLASYLWIPLWPNDLLLVRCYFEGKVVTGPSARVFAEHDPAAIAWSGECRQRRLCPNLDLASASRAAELLYAGDVHGRTGAPVPQFVAARAERVRSLDPHISRVEREGIAALDAVPLEGLQEELRHD